MTVVDVFVVLEKIRHDIPYLPVDGGIGDVGGSQYGGWFSGDFPGRCSSKESPVWWGTCHFLAQLGTHRKP